MVDRAIIERSARGRALAFMCALGLGVTLTSETLHAQSPWGGNQSVIVNESVLDSLGPGGAGSPYAPPGAATPGAYPYPSGSYSRYGGALLFPPPQLPRSTLTVAPPSAAALSAVPPLPRSADRPRATARATPAPAPQAPRQTASQPRPQPATPAAKPPPPPIQQAATPAPPAPPPTPQVAATPEPAPQAEAEAEAAAADASQAAPLANASVDDMELPPPAPLPSFTDEAEPIVPTVGLNGQENRQTLFTGGPSPSGGLLAEGNTGAAGSQENEAPAAAPPPPPAPEPVTASDAERAAPLATGNQNAESLARGDAPTASETGQRTEEGEQPPVVAAQPAVPTQQAALTPASVRPAGEVRLPFGSTQIDLDGNQEALLTPLVDQLRSDERAAVRVQAYASGEASDPNKARRLSLQRALKVRKYFIDQGIRSVRVEVRALGMSGPDGSVDRVDVLPVQR